MRTIITAMAAMAFAAATVAAPAAVADVGLPATTDIHWAGTPCIQIASAARLDPTQTAVDTVCSADGNWSFTEGNIWPGDAFGADPIMGDAGYIECGVFRGGVQVWSDSAFAGDGSDVTCLREAV